MEAVKVNQTDRTFQVHGIIPASKKELSESLSKGLWH